MTRTLPTEIATASTAASSEPFIAIELDFVTQPLFFWTGWRDLVVGGDTYTGAGSLLGISEIGETAEVAPQGVAVSLNGIPSDLIALALAEPYQGRVATISLGVLDSAGVSSDLLVLFTGYMDQMNIAEAAEVCNITLMIESKLIDLERARIQRYTSESQKSRWPTDQAFDFVIDLQERQLTFGRAGNDDASIVTAPVSQQGPIYINDQQGP